MRGEKFIKNAHKKTEEKLLSRSILMRFEVKLIASQVKILAQRSFSLQFYWASTMYAYGTRHANSTNSVPGCRFFHTKNYFILKILVRE